MTRQTIRYWTALWLGLAALVLLSCAAVFLLHSHNEQMHKMREQAAQTRARLMAQSIGQRLAQATSTGIPLSQLIGVPEFLERWQKNHPEVTYIEVNDLQAHLLWSARNTQQSIDDATNHTESAANAVVDVTISLHMRSDSLEDPEKTTALLGPAILLVSTLAYLAAHFACAQGPWLRNHGLKIIARWLAKGDYRRVLVLPQHKYFDLRVQELSHAMRSVHERMTRMRQLVGSLRRTEPQQLRRDYLDFIFKRTVGNDQFTDHAPTVVRLVAVQTQSLWMSLLLSLSAMSPLTFVLLISQNAASNHTRPALLTASLAVLVLAGAAGWNLLAHLRISTLGVLLLSNMALLLPLLALLFGNEFHPYWLAAWNGCFAGAALAACTCAQTHPDQNPGFTHVRPYVPGAALLAWWGGLLWLAPALGYYAYAALPQTWAILALLLPIVCILFFATRWDVAHSPWRVHQTSSPPPDEPERMRWMALGIATGLAAGTTLYETALTAPTSSSALLGQCAQGIGLGLGIIWTLWRPPQHSNPYTRHWLVIAVVTVALQWLSALALPGLPDIAQALSALLLGLLLGHGLTQIAHQPQGWVTQRLLLCSALGATLCAIAVALSLQPWLGVFAALLLLPAHALPHTKVLNAH